MLAFNMLAKDPVFFLLILALSCFLPFGFAAKLPQEEADTLQQIATTMGATYWEFNADSCEVKRVGIMPQAPMGSQGEVDCDCSFEDNTVCHVTKIVLKSLSLPGVLPPELVKLPYLREIDFAYNYLNGTIPAEWASTSLTSISILGNRVSGEIPKELGNITNLTFLNLEANQFSGNVPSELGKLINLETLMLSSNKLTGNLPRTLALLGNLTNFRINDNNFNGVIPDFIQNWKQLTRLEMHASGLEGPIPVNISLLHNLVELRISDISGPTQGFPVLRDITGIQRLVLRNCSIEGEIHSYIWQLRDLQMLDVSFNKLVGEIPDANGARSLKFLFLTGNLLTGKVPESILQDGSSIDLSYNNFTWQSPEQPACRPNMNYYVNLFKSSSTGNAISDVVPCMKDVNCPRYGCSFRVNCGGNDLTIREANGRVLYEGDAEVEGGMAARNFRSSSGYWGFSSTGDFMDDNNYQNTRYITDVMSTNISELYTTARLSPLSLTYFSYCLENGDYNVSLHFAETQFTNDNTYKSLGSRLFDIYIQGKLVWNDVNIEDEAHGVQKPLIKHSNASVTSNILEIRFYWAGKGTTRIPNRGVYGPLVSAISVVPNFKICKSDEKKNVAVYVAVGILALCVSCIIFGILWWKGFLGCRKKRGKDFERLEFQTVSFTLKQMKAATNNFDSANKIGEGGFGPVYRGLLPDGTIIAVKQLSAKSRQGNREFLNEIGMISCLQHPNLVKLHGCCIEGDQLLLVYEFMENNSLAQALFGSLNSQLVLDWPTRFKICMGIARGLSFLHEESRLRIVHRDIKATNVLLDKDLNPKISDFGLARLNEDEKSHISTRIAGTIGYMAPEYALWGYLTYKADVYSFGVVALEIISGKNNNNYMPSRDCICLLDWAIHLEQSGNLEELLDERLSQVNRGEFEMMVKVALLCISASPTLRPTMTEVVSMLEGEMAIPDVIPGLNTYTDDLRFKSIKDFRRERQNQDSSRSQTLNIETDAGSSSTCTFDKYDINPDSRSY